MFEIFDSRSCWFCDIKFIGDVEVFGKFEEEGLELGCCEILEVVEIFFGFCGWVIGVGLNLVRNWMFFKRRILCVEGL